MTGAIAHDFNNLTPVVLANMDLLDDPGRRGTNARAADRQRQQKRRAAGS